VRARLNGDGVQDPQAEGLIPNLERVHEILLMISECDKHSHDEASWNSMVHYPTLRIALPVKDSLGQMVQVTSKATLS
jgi:PD-(D/E)XK nuclease superfamily protein